MKDIIEKSIQSSLSYSEYRNLISSLLAEGKSTGHVQNEDLRHYSELNVARMNRIEKTVELLPEVVLTLKQLPKKYIWLVLSEGWCGDAANIVPVLHKMAEVTEQIELRIALRDDHDDLMQHFLTNGGKAIPKLIIIDKATSEVVGDWGPRPKGAKDLILNYKKEHGVVDETAKSELQLWYLHDKGISTQEEILGLITESVEV